MKKSLIAVLVAAVLVASFSVVGVSAQSETPGYGYGNGLQQQLQSEDGLELYHDEIMAAFSEALGLSIEEIEARVEAGETIADIALAEGLTFEEFKALMPVGNFGTRGATRMGRGAMVNGENAQFTQGPLALGDGTCLEDGQPVREFAGQMGQGRGRGW